MPWFDCAVKRPISTNMGGTLAPNLGLILHHAVANGSLWGFFNSPSAQVSAHFWVALDGTIEQYVNTDIVAWHAKQLNGRYVGVETEGCVDPPYAQPMSEAMITSLATLYTEGNRHHGWPFTEINADGQSGFGYHRMAVNTACPCDVRVATREIILAMAQGSKPKPPPVQIPEGEVMSVEIITQNGKEYMVSNIVAGGRLIQVTQDASTVGSASNGQNTRIIDMTAQWPGQLSDVTSA